jgi:hypothetical protein
MRGHNASRADPRRGMMLRLVAFTPETPPVEVAEIAEPELGHLELFDDDRLLAIVVIRPFIDANEVEVGVADASWEWLTRTRLSTSKAGT